MTDAPIGEPPYPVQFSVEYPDRELDRVTTAFRIFTVIPIAIVLAAVSGPDISWAKSEAAYSGGISAGGILFLAPLLMIVFRQKYPRWWFDWNLNLVRFENRVFSYLVPPPRRVSVNRRRAGSQRRLPLSRLQERYQPLAAAGEMAPGDSPLHSAVLPGTRHVRGNHHRLVRDTLYWALPSRAVRFRGRSDALGQPRTGICLCPDYGPLPAVPAGTVAQDASSSAIERMIRSGCTATGSRSPLSSSIFLGRSKMIASGNAVTTSSP